MYASVRNPNTTPGSSLRKAFWAWRMFSLDSTASVVLLIPLSLASFVVAFMFIPSRTVAMSLKAMWVPRKCPDPETD